MAGVRATRASRTTLVDISTMVSADPVVGPGGYPLLLQTGETRDGFTPLYDRQHPHDLFMELSAAFRIDVGAGIGLFAYLAPVGEPALGPPTYLHRPSGHSLPATPISHHWLDATHISYGVATIGAVVADRITLEASAFNGREPDHHRWGFDTPGLGSYAVRIGVYPTFGVSLQVSGASLREPERIHPGMDILRLTASIAYARSWSTGSWRVTTGFGANKRDALVLRLGNVTLTVPSRTQVAGLIESALRWRSSEIAGRVEIVEKDELFPTLDPRHNTVYRVGKLHLGLRRRIVNSPGGTLSMGAAAAVHVLPDDLASVYGTSPVTGQVFAQWTIP